MSLQGTLDTLSLPELCELLSGTNKTGALHVRAEAGQGVLWFTAGKVCAGEAGGQTGPPPPGAGGDLLERLHDVCFELFRFTEGSFEFEADRRPSWSADRGVEVTGLLAETDRRMAEWREIIAVIPSIEARPRLVPEPPSGGPITLDATQWRVVTGIDGRRRVSALIRVLDGGEFTVCKVLRSLVQAGLVEIDADPSSASGTGDNAATAAPAGAGGRSSAEAAAGSRSDDASDAAPPARTGRGQSRPVPDRDPVSVDEPGSDHGTDLDPLADGLDRGAVVALLASARSK
ncbi:MAG TPA: DUF4388 domain-containing protein [Acidimicrobiia bacterium]|nr:DUF4388 domain-containing protein [Acidimicrobiia bacterium]